jgi:putative tryptophan/tyrosine transport system substrate-binding protein
MLRRRLLRPLVDHAGDRMRRREVITLIGGVAVAWPLAVRPQQLTIPVIGFLNSASPDETSERFHAFHQGLSETGYVVGHNVALQYRWADHHYDRLPQLAAELVRRQVAVIAATTVPAVPAAKVATATIPIVFVTGVDPVQDGLVASLNRPGGNLAGVTTLSVEVGSKQLELLHELGPTTTTAAVLVNPNLPLADAISQDAQRAATTLGLQLQVLHASADDDLDTAFATLAHLRAVVLVIGADTFLISRSRQLAALARRNAIPASHYFREFVVAGGLMSYGSNVADAYRLAGVCAGRILNGEKPADLPVQQPTKFELVINLKTAKALGLTIPPSIMVRADEVLE